MHQLFGIIDSEFVDHILANETQEDPSDEMLFRSRGHDSPISGEDDNMEWLGQHHDMSSPGKIALHRDRIGRQFWACVHRLDGNDDTKTDPALRRQLCQSMVNLVLAHERFHHFCDVIGRITGYRGGEGSNYKYDWKTEEALATTWGWQYAQRHFASIPGFPRLLREAFIDWRFGAISLLGYEDWKKFSHFCFFKEGLSQHLNPNGAIDFAAGTDIDSGSCLYTQLEALAWSDSSITYWKAVDGNENPWEEIKTETTCTATLDSSRPPKWIEVTSRFCHERRTNLKNIHEEINASSILANDLNNHDGIICLNGNPIKSHLLGLLMISDTGLLKQMHISVPRPKVKQIGLYGLSDPLLKAVKIINKYAGKGRKGVIDAQNELIEAGLEEFAQS